jgi:hypothetical protein
MKPFDASSIIFNVGSSGRLGYGRSIFYSWFGGIDSKEDPTSSVKKGRKTSSR